ncbi:MAG: hypothetical protein ACKO7B_12885, partial [Flavobacteriales bacterium]
SFVENYRMSNTADRRERSSAMNHIALAQNVLGQGHAIVFPSLHDLFLRIYYGQEVERFYVNEETLNRMYDRDSYNYWDLKELYSQDD